MISLRRLEEIAAEAELRCGQAKFPGCLLETGTQEVGPRALTLHPSEEAGIVVAAAAERLNRRHHLACAVRKMFVEPGAEERCDLVRQPDRQVEATTRACLGARLDDRLQLMIRDLRNDRCDRDVAWDAGIVERLDGCDPPMWRGRARLERSGGLRIE